MPHAPAVLPTGFRPQGDVPLVRLGRDNDGGYLVDRRNLDHADLLIGMGIGRDWSFEEDFLSRRPVPLLTYDRTVSGWEFFVELYRRIVMLEPINAWAAWKDLWRRWRFWRTADRQHFVQFVGRDHPPGMISLPALVRRDVPDHARNIFLKIDIEWAEYHILDDLIELAPRIEGLVIEIHDVDRNTRRVEDFMDRFPLMLAHVHVNNARLPTEDDVPQFVECTFTRRDPTGPWSERPLHPLDQPCLPLRRDIGIVFRDTAATRGHVA